ncbi:MAG TPA: glycosyltransferase family 4 protein [Steroidobacter sp.]
MRVLYFHQHFSTPQGSTGTRSYEFCKRLIAQGHSVTLVCGSYGGGVTGLSGPYRWGMRRGLVDGIDVIEFYLPYSNADRFIKRALVFLKFMFRSTRLALSAGYDMIFATSTPLTVAVPGIIAKVVRGRRFVFEVRDLWPELPREMGVITNPAVLWGMDVLESLAYRFADACIGLAPGIVAGIKRKRADVAVAMIPNGSDVDMSSLSHPLPANTRAALNQLDGKLKCVFTGTHGIANGLDAVLDAAAEMKRRGRNDIALLFIGDGMLKPRLVKRAASEGLDNCIFLDPLPKQVLVSLQREVDVGLMILANVAAFYNGTSPNKFFDYLASGLPVLINYPGWLAKFVADQQCGVVVPPADPKAFADALERLADFPAERQRMGQQARRLAEQTFARDLLARQFVTFLEGVARGKAVV